MAPWRSRLDTATTYARGWFPASGAAPRQLVIITPGRTGSELLVGMLDTHPAIACDGEILTHPRRQPRRYIAGRARRAPRDGVYGWKAITSQLEWYPEHYPDPAAFLAGCVGPDGLLVVLRRRNLLNQALSVVHGEETGFHFRSAGAFTPMRVEPERLLAQLYWYDAADQWLVETTSSLPQLSLFYEDDLLTEREQQATVATVCERLQLPFVFTGSELVRVAPADPLERVANVDEVAEALAGTRYAAFLDHRPSP